jgi:hypothetical protein
MSNEQRLIIQTRKIIASCLNIHSYLGAKQSSLLCKALENEWQRSEIPYTPLSFRTGNHRGTDEETPHYLCYGQMVVTTLHCACIDDEHRLSMYELLETLHHTMGILIAFGGRRLLAERIYAPVHSSLKSEQQTSYGDML